MSHRTTASILAILLNCAIAPDSLAGDESIVLYVDASADGDNTGSGWENAFTDLNDALDATDFLACCPNGGCEIWVAAGTYKPDRGTGDETLSFETRDCISIYGGFTGTETSRDQRDWDTNETILSGDLNEDDVEDIGTALFCLSGNSEFFEQVDCTPFDLNKDGDVNEEELNISDNSEHIIISRKASPTARIDGLTITAGHASDGNPNRGAGILITNGSPTIQNCRILANHTFFNGGGIYIRNSSPTFLNCSFIGNSSRSNRGGAIVVDEFSQASISECEFSENSANLGGAIHIDDANVVITNSRFFGNRSIATGGGAVYCFGDNGQLWIHNSEFSGNMAFSGAAISSAMHLTVSNCTFSRNQIFLNRNGAGIRQTSNNLSIVNSVFWNNSGTDGPIESAQIDMFNSVAANVHCSIIQGCDDFCFDSSQGNSSANPTMVNALGDDGVVGTTDDDLRLLPVSPAIDRGTNDALLADAFDLDHDGNVNEPTPFDVAGTKRFVRHCFSEITPARIGDLPQSDLGAHEFQPHDIDGDGRVTIFDFDDLQQCLTGPDASSLDPSCDMVDTDCDDDVDLLDFAVFQTSHTG